MLFTLAGWKVSLMRWHYLNAWCFVTQNCSNWPLPLARLVDWLPLSDNFSTTVLLVTSLLVSPIVAFQTEENVLSCLIYCSFSYWLIFCQIESKCHIMLFFWNLIKKRQWYQTEIIRARIADCFAEDLWSDYYLPGMLGQDSTSNQNSEAKTG